MRAICARVFETQLKQTDKLIFLSTFNSSFILFESKRNASTQQLGVLTLAKGTAVLASTFVSSTVDPLKDVVADSHARHGVGEAERAAGTTARCIPAEFCACVQQCPHHATTQRRVAEA